MRGGRLVFSLSLVVLAMVVLNVCLVNQLASEGVAVARAATPVCRVSDTVSRTEAGVALVSAQTDLGSLLVPKGWRCEVERSSGDERVVVIVNPEERAQYIRVLVSACTTCGVSKQGRKDPYLLLPQGIPDRAQITDTVLAYERRVQGSPYPNHGLVEFLQPAGYAQVDVLLPDAKRPAATAILNATIR